MKKSRKMVSLKRAKEIAERTMKDWPAWKRCGLQTAPDRKPRKDI